MHASDISHHDSILLVDDDPTLRVYVKGMLDMDGCDVTEAETAEEALQANAKDSFDVILLDIVLPRMSGFDALRELKRQDENVHVVMLTGEPSVDGALEAMKHGAYDYLTKPVDVSRLRNIVHRAAAHRRLTQENRLLRTLVSLPEPGGPLVAKSPAMKRLVQEMDRVADGADPLLILGEPGAGKTVVARHVHRRSSRSRRPFVHLNCRDVPPLLAEDELLGHEWSGAGEDPDALHSHAGLFEIATGGTLFVDHFSELAPRTQAKLARVLATGEVQRLASHKKRPANVRLIAASSENLSQRVRGGSIRKDLYSRLQSSILKVPSLRERREDIPELAAYYLERFRGEGRPTARLTPEALALLQEHSWPGNVRELAHALENAALHAKDLSVRPSDLPTVITRSGN